MARSVVVGVAGGSASGKSTVVAEVVRLLGTETAVILRHDAYYHDLSHLTVELRREVNVDHPDSLETALLVEHVNALQAGQSIEMPSYDYATQTRGPAGVVLEPAPVLIVEGLFTLWDERLRALMDLKAFVDVSEEERLARRLDRDVRERGRDPARIARQHERRVQPMHEQYVEPSRQWADLMIRGGGQNLAAVDELAARIRRLLELRG
jgi:uridine kinase